MPDRLPWTLQAYWLLTWVATPLAPLLLMYRLRRGKEDRHRLAERTGVASLQRPDGSLIWLHGASVGEVVAAVPLVERLCPKGFKVLLTSGTVTSAELAAQRMPPSVVHQFVPLDSPRYVRRFLDHWRPDLALFMESDLWPNMIVAAHARRIPLVLVNGRMSDRSFRRWRRAPRAIAALLRRFQLCLAQSQEDAERYAVLGATVNITGNLKVDVAPPPVDSIMLDAMQTTIGARPVMAAASTHPGEEAIMIEVHLRLRERVANLLTIVAPRHPGRGAEIAADARGKGLTVRLRSRGESPEGADIYMFDTVGELGLLYRLAPIVFMGGSLATHGGQNPIEAAKLGAAVLHGPHVWNFAEVYAALDAAHGAIQIADAAALEMHAHQWLTEPASRERAALAARRTVEALAGALDRTLAALEPYQPQLRPADRLGDA